MSALTDALHAGREAEQRRAARAVLRNPLVRSTGRNRELFGLVTRYQRELRAWFDRETGWQLTITAETARLRKIATGPDPSYPALEIAGSRLPFSRRRYVLLCLALAALERSEAQITLGRLAEQVLLGCADPALTATGLVFALERREERADMVAVVRMLIELGVLERVAGDEQSFVSTTGDVLYDVHRRTSSLLLAGPRGPSMLTTAEDRCAALTWETPPATDELRVRRIRHRITRILLDEPVLYYDRLTADELAYLTGQRTALCRRITEFTGLLPEVRAEGIAMVDPFDDLTDVRMPEVGTNGHVTLLIAERLGRSIGTPVAIADLHAMVRELAVEFTRSRVWRAGAADPGAETELVRTALTKLSALRLIEHDPAGDRVTPLPAIARYGVAAPTVAEPGTPTRRPSRKRR